MFVGLNLVLIERRPPSDVHSQVEEAVAPVDQKDEAGYDEAGEGEGTAGGCQV